jgi:hypothetical protein
MQDSNEVKEMATDKEMLERIQKLVVILNKEPDQAELQRTPDGKAQYLPIDFIETRLDEVFFGLWETHDFKYINIGGQLAGHITLEITHPLTGNKLKRIGAAGVTVQQGMADLQVPELKTECIKNAAKSLGKSFGRSLNRKFTDKYEPLIKEITPESLKALMDEKIDKLNEQEQADILRIINEREANSYEKTNKLLRSL